MSDSADECNKKPAGGIRDTQNRPTVAGRLQAGRSATVPKPAGSADSTLDPGLSNAMPINPKSETAKAKKNTREEALRSPEMSTDLSGAAQAQATKIVSRGATLRGKL